MRKFLSVFVVMFIVGSMNSWSDDNYFQVGAFKDGLAIVTQNNKFGFINEAGEIVIPIKFDKVWEFRKDGLAKIRIGDSRGFINKSGKIILLDEEDWLEKSGIAFVIEDFINEWTFKEGLGIIRKKIKAREEANFYGERVAYPVWNYGFIDETGSIVIPIQYDKVYNFSNGLARVRKVKWGIVNKTGKEVVPTIYDDIGEFKEGVAKVSSNKKFGLVDKTGKIITPVIFDSIDDSKYGVTLIELNGKYGLIDKETGKLIIPCEYNRIGDFKDGLAKVELNGESFYINKKGERVK